MSIYWPIALAVLADIAYQIASKSTPSTLNPFASLSVTYIIGALVSTGVFFLTSRGGSLVRELHELNWTTFLLGIAIVGLEGGSIYMYKVGWNVNTGYIVKAILVGISLIFIGALLYRERITLTKVAGIAVCLLGLYLINR